jgi:hypothetical protein
VIARRPIRARTRRPKHRALVGPGLSAAHSGPLGRAVDRARDRASGRSYRHRLQSRRPARTHACTATPSDGSRFVTAPHVRTNSQGSCPHSDLTFDSRASQEVAHRDRRSDGRLVEAFQCACDDPETHRLYRYVGRAGREPPEPLGSWLASPNARCRRLQIGAAPLGSVSPLATEPSAVRARSCANQPRRGGRFCPGRVGAVGDSLHPAPRRCRSDRRASGQCRNLPRHHRSHVARSTRWRVYRP